MNRCPRCRMDLPEGFSYCPFCRTRFPRGPGIQFPIVVALTTVFVIFILVLLFG